MLAVWYQGTLSFGMLFSDERKEGKFNLVKLSRSGLALEKVPKKNNSAVK